MPEDSRIFRNEELVLDMPSDIDPDVWNEDPYEPFIDELCGHREYQKDAIRAAMRFFAGGRFSNIAELASFNFAQKEALRARYRSEQSFHNQLLLPDKLACSLDIATGAGKSYVMYGVAAIMLAEGIVDRVLVLCPTLTIEAGLRDKFRELSASAELTDLLPAGSKTRNPSVISAAESLTKGSICVENYHAVLEHVSSSIRESLEGQGSRTLVLNDETHHVWNAPGGKVHEWKNFLADADFDFRYIMGVSGTCYVDDDYFTDVIFRYSLRQAIEERFVKRIEYIAEMPETSAVEEKWQLVHQRHADNKRRLKSRGIKPLTILVTKDIASCKQVAQDLIEFLSDLPEYENIDTSKLVLPVTSAREHQPNLAELSRVDQPESSVEFIVSVAMLSEGWDVKNVFQIVPHEERAFNSKLLISQILGRGLRRPEPWSGADPIVTVFNHDAWSVRIRQLVNEVLEIERRVTSRVNPASPYNFDLHHLDYTRLEDVSEFAKKGEYRLFKNGYVELPTQVEAEDVSIGYVDATTERETQFKGVIEHKTWSAAEIALQMHNRLRAIDEESKDADDPDDRTAYSEKFTAAVCEEVVNKSLEMANVTSGRVIDTNRQRFLQALGTLRRKSAKRVVYKLRAEGLKILNTAARPADSVSAAEIRRGSKTVYHTDASAGLVDEEQQEFFAEVVDPDGEFVAGQVRVENASDLKSALNFVIADATPERRFIRALVTRQNAMAIDAWLKNSAARFYGIEFAWKKGDHPKRGEFNPDFFVLQGDVCIVVEIKSDDEIVDPSPENVKKYQFAKDHFEAVNDRLRKEGEARRYHFTMLTPTNFNTFFQKIREKEPTGFTSELDVILRAHLD
tara:strand:+ start:64 stop:2619 length:2556 start_codon:yes stop_codon:yes gene_type:complete